MDNQLKEKRFGFGSAYVPSSNPSDENPLGDEIELDGVYKRRPKRATRTIRRFPTPEAAIAFRNNAIAVKEKRLTIDEFVYNIFVGGSWIIIIYAISKCMKILGGGKKIYKKYKGGNSDSESISRVVELFKAHPSLIDIFADDVCPVDEGGKAAAEELYHILEDKREYGGKRKKSMRKKRARKTRKSRK